MVEEATDVFPDLWEVEWRRVLSCCHREVEGGMFVERGKEGGVAVERRKECGARLFYMSLPLFWAVWGRLFFYPSVQPNFMTREGPCPDLLCRFDG